MYEELKGLANSDIYPFHMPGHKRQPSKSIFDAAFSFDITEIDGFDNMHHPEAIIKELQERMAEVFHADEAAILVNGSSSGILTAISAAVKKNGKIIMARNSHKSAYNAAYLRNLEISFIYPEFIGEYAMNGGIEQWEVRRAIEENPDAEAVFITSPTYEGYYCDVEKIADYCHENNTKTTFENGRFWGFIYRCISACRVCCAKRVEKYSHRGPAWKQNAIGYRDIGASIICVFIR